MAPSVFRAGLERNSFLSNASQQIRYKNVSVPSSFLYLKRVYASPAFSLDFGYSPKGKTVLGNTMNTKHRDRRFDTTIRKTFTVTLSNLCPGLPETCGKNLNIITRKGSKLKKTYFSACDRIN